MGVIISIANHKGGVGKTATSCNLGHALARSGKKTLVIDMDLQCNTTSTLFGNDQARYGLCELLNPDEDIDVQKCIYGTAYEDLYIIPNSRETAAMEQRLIKSYPDGLNILKKRLTKYALNNFDFTIIDCPPNLGTFVICAMMCSNFVIVPNETGSKYAMEGLNEAVKFIEDIRENGNEELRFLKVLLTKADGRELVHKASIAQIRSFYPPEKVFNTIIPGNTAVQQAEMLGKTIFKHRSNARAAVAYKNLSEEIINTLKKKD
ncbi:MAG: ParA family protein [Desulfobacteraceae bacterium]|nr:ParA family protein [Desulfobacteraceae bacterium]